MLSTREGEGRRHGAEGRVLGAEGGSGRHPGVLLPLLQGGHEAAASCCEAGRAKSQTLRYPMLRFRPPQSPWVSHRAMALLPPARAAPKHRRLGFVWCRVSPGASLGVTAVVWDLKHQGFIQETNSCETPPEPDCTRCLVVRSG